MFAEAGVPRHPDALPAVTAPEKAERLARIAADGVELTVAVDSRRGGRDLSAALARHGATAQLLVELDVGLTAPASRRAGAVAGGAGPRRAARGRGGRHQLLPGPLPGRRRDRARPADGGRRAAARGARRLRWPPASRCDRISGGSTPTRYLTHETCVTELRSGTYALVRPQRPARRGRRARRAVGRGDRHLRRGARPDRGRRGLEDAHVGLARRRRPRRLRRLARTPACTTSTRSTATSTSASLERAARGRRPRSGSSRTTPAAA